ncbi:MAG: hypothetical protein JG764_975 [Clostridiales bacterium]|jgi:EAL domain-containing protein (putative c-di-GMP-specific phosphodiesterase class I)|nr:hypothetical protein [Clostridiales bacterium]
MSRKKKNEALKRALSGEIQTYLQPVVNIKEGCIEGWEALTRGPRGSVLESPNRLFFYAKEKRKTHQLEHRCIKNGLNVLKNIGDKKLFINVGSSIFTSRLDGIAESFSRQFKNSNVVLEITEHSNEEMEKITDAAAWYRSQGISIAVDDITSGHDRLRTVLYIKPEYFKLDRDLIANCNRDKDRRNIINHLFQLGQSIDSKVIAEGVQTNEELYILRQIGIELCQGFIFSRPFPAEELNKKTEREVLQVV